MSETPTRNQFGKRRPAVPPAPRPPAKRSGHVALLVMGTLAVGTTAYTMMPRQSCDPTPSSADAAAQVQAATQTQTNTACSGSGHGSSGSGGSSHWPSRLSFFGGDTTSHSGSGSSSFSSPGSVSRGGFGSFGHGFSGGG